MGVNKLDIEFEDDEEIQAREEAEKKKSEVLEDVDLEFGVESGDSSAQKTPAPQGGGTSESDAIKKAREAARQRVKEAKSIAPEKAAESTPSPQPQAQAQQQQAQAQAQEQQAQPQPQQQQQQQQAALPQAQFQQLPQAQVYVGPDYKLGDELKKVAASNQVLAVEIEARVKIEVTQQLNKITAENHANNKLLEHKINKILTQINQKVPALKNELMMIKKLLKEHSSLSDEEGQGAGSDSSTQADKPKTAQQAAARQQAKKKAA